MCPQWPDRCCLCMTKKDGVVLTGLVSMLFDLAFIILCTYTTYEPEIWNLSKLLFFIFFLSSYYFFDYVIPSHIITTPLLQTQHETGLRAHLKKKYYVICRS